MKKKQVLLVENSKLIAIAYQQLFDTQPFEIIYHASYQQAKTFLEETEDPVFAAIVDLNLSDSKNGEIVDLTLSYHIPTIVLFGSENSDVLQKVQQKPLIDYIQKNEKKDFESALEHLQRLDKNQNIKILIVDDSSTYLALYEDLLHRQLFNVVKAEDGLQALRILSQNPDVKLIISDYEMPNKNGFQLIEEVRKHFTKEELPILIVSGINDNAVNSQCLKAGANDFIYKPFIEKEFYSRVYLNVGFIEYLSELEKHQILLKQYRFAVDESSIVSKTDINGIITYVNDAFCAMSGYSREELLGQNHNIVRNFDTHLRVYQDLWSTIMDKKVWRGIVKNCKKNGDAYYVDTTVIPILDKDGNIDEFISIRHDVTTLVEQQNIINKQTTDELTGLVNRQKLLEDIQLPGEKILVLLNIDCFKEINDFYGFELADQILLMAAIKIEQLLQGSFRLYKLPADEFVLMSDNCAAQSKEIEIFVAYLIESLQSINWHVDDHEITLNWSAGIAHSQDKLLVKADFALQHAKNQKKSYAVYNDNTMNFEQYGSNLKWIKKIKDGLVEERFVSYFQPIIDNKTLEIAKFESLIRLMDSENKPISPYFFLDIAKKTKLYSQLTHAVVKNACQFIKGRSESISINLTLADIINDDTVVFLEKMVLDNRLQNKIIFEIVESEGIEEESRVVAFIKKMKEHGCQFAIDDFGTGYSNFEYLIKLDIDFIKIDGSIIKKICSDTNAEIVAAIIVDFASKLGVKTIAEFVENEAIFNKCVELGIDYSQGYYFYQPLSEEELIVKEL